MTRDFPLWPVQDFMFNELAGESEEEEEDDDDEEMEEEEEEESMDTA